MIGLYSPGTSPLHRAPAAAKLLALLVGMTALLVARSPLAVAVGAAVTALGVLVSGVSVATAWAQLWPMRWFVLLLVPLQWWSGGWRSVAVVVGTLVVSVLAAALITLTTRVSALLDVMEQAARPLRRVGVDPERVALVLALTIRAVPVLTATFEQVRDARRARGLERSGRALLVPLVVRTVRHADQLGEALVARGVDD